MFIFQRGGILFLEKISICRIKSFEKFSLLVFTFISSSILTSDFSFLLIRKYYYIKYIRFIAKLIR